MDEVSTQLAHAINDAINEKVAVLGGPQQVRGSQVTEALLACVAARMAIARQNCKTMLSWEVRRSMTVALFDAISLAMEGLPQPKLGSVSDAISALEIWEVR